MSTDKEIYQIAMAQTGKSFSDLRDDDINDALGTDNAISRSKDGDPKEQEELSNSIRSAQRRYGITPDESDEEFSKIIELIRRRAGLG